MGPLAMNPSEDLRSVESQSGRSEEGAVEDRLLTAGAQDVQGSLELLSCRGEVCIGTHRKLASTVRHRGHSCMTTTSGPERIPSSPGRGASPSSQPRVVEDLSSGSRPFPSSLRRPPTIHWSAASVPLESSMSPPPHCIAAHEPALILRQAEAGELPSQPHGADALAPRDAMRRLPQRAAEGGG